jgi:hypothetical protein
MHICTPMTKCKRDSSDRLTKVNCTVDENVVCLGSRNFHKKGETSYIYEREDRNMSLVRNMMIKIRIKLPES